MTLTAEEWRERNAQQDDAWSETEAHEGSRYMDPPDGTYQGTVWGFDFLDLDAGDFLKIELQVASGDHAGAITGELYSLSDKDRLPYTKAALKKIGVDVDSTPLSEIYPGSQVLEAVLDVPVEFVVKRSKKTRDDGTPYVNIYINKALGGPLRADGSGFDARTDVPVDESDFQPGPLPTVAEDDDIPF